MVPHQSSELSGEADFEVIVDFLHPMDCASLVKALISHLFDAEDDGFSYRYRVILNLTCSDYSWLRGPAHISLLTGSSIPQKRKTSYTHTLNHAHTCITSKIISNYIGVEVQKIFSYIL